MNIIFNRKFGQPKPWDERSEEKRKSSTRRVRFRYRDSLEWDVPFFASKLNFRQSKNE